MKLSIATTVVTTFLVGTDTIKSTCGFSSPSMMMAVKQHQRQIALQMGYLDDLSKELRSTADPNPNLDEEDREMLKMSKDQIDRAGPGSWDSYVEFEEFDGGDGQMGVAGDGNKKLEKFDMSEMAKSKTMSYVKEMRKQNSIVLL
jgi:hypothetical protein